MFNLRTSTENWINYYRIPGAKHKIYYMLQNKLTYYVKICIIIKTNVFSRNTKGGYIMKKKGTGREILKIFCFY